ncbi:unnamed protein product [Chondrus crispus]|uniref:Reverse transcriptase Ty1/copia-type domain-containing protein n=1 Tax=Chondrus crispus TaxID=2769 RepID=R7QEP6_CHOCR|nr:unnamed protein product [Chondrus crispus]CDF35900.1 unnamed protein product [Chondrus crispus]|eukprot:XP_005715719.1 unnamed protein product [Chondrus crispus]
MTDCNPKPTPSPPKVNAAHDATTPLLPAPQSSHFRRILGDLRYLADSTRFDIHPTVNRLAPHMNQPHEAHWNQLKWLLRYLKCAPDHGILFSTSPAQPLLSTCTDADFANAKNRRSTSGIVHTIHAAPISWTSSIQDTVALSICAAEYLAATLATQQTNWLCRLLSDFHATPKKPVKLHIDNQAALRIALQFAPPSAANSSISSTTTYTITSKSVSSPPIIYPPTTTSPTCSPNHLENYASTNS